MKKTYIVIVALVVLTFVLLACVEEGNEIWLKQTETKDGVTTYSFTLRNGRVVEVSAEDYDYYTVGEKFP